MILVVNLKIMSLKLFPKLTFLFSVSLAHKRPNKMDRSNGLSVVLMTSSIPSGLNHFTPPHISIISFPQSASNSPLLRLPFLSSTPIMIIFAILGARAIQNTSATQSHKLQTHSIKCVFLGYRDHFCGYRFFDPSNNKFHLYRHVNFDETSFPFVDSSPPPSYYFLNDPPFPSVSYLPNVPT